MSALYKVSQGCTLCRTCLFMCPVNAIEIRPEGAIIDEKLCIGCGNCYNNCASEAIIREEKKND